MVAEWKIAVRLAQQNYCCPWCGGYLPLEFANPEHILPQSMGGTDALENIAAAHKPCNAKRSSNIHQDPAPGPQFEFIRKRLKWIRDAEKYPDGLMIMRRGNNGKNQNSH